MIELRVAQLKRQFFFKRYFEKRNKIGKIHMDSEKSINSFKMKKGQVTWIFIQQLFCLPIFQ